MKHIQTVVLIAPLLLATAAAGDNQVATLRGVPPLDQDGTASQIPEVINSDIRKVRNYPDQPPLIPHKIDNYQIDLNANKCLTCHSRTAIEISQAPMVSVTHFMNRAGQTLATVSPRRFFCTQCHVVQHDVRPLVQNDFADVDHVLEFVRSNQKAAD
ncbi:nitrate reductase cytochrome c-type subunit [Rhodobacteraceae bacterium F11138]|nr:nitrate reductase cytochrome c-type subunit [Rhodobacteraceae bacterium F11138]